VSFRQSWLGTMHKRLRALICVACVLVSLPLTLWLTSEIAVQYELLATGASARAELGDDLGLGVLLFVFALPAALVLSLLLGVVVWRLTRRSASAALPTRTPPGTM
jgi:hypothetical protein